MGISFGGMIAQCTTLARPDLVRSLTLIGTASHFPEEVQRGMRARAETVRAGGDGCRCSVKFRTVVHNRRRERSALTSSIVLRKRSWQTIPPPMRQIWDVIATLDIQGRLPEIQCPTLILVGERDPSTPPSTARELSEAIRGAKMTVIPDASHIVTAEKPTAVNDALRAFLKQCHN